MILEHTAEQAEKLIMDCINLEAVKAGEKLIKMIKDMRTRIHVKSKTSILSNKLTASDAIVETKPDSLEELVVVGVFTAGYSIISAPIRENNKITDAKEADLLTECGNYLSILRKMSIDIQNKLKAQNLVYYLQGDYSSVEYEGKFLEKIFLDEIDEKKIILYSYIIDEIEWNNKLLQTEE